MRKTFLMWLMLSIVILSHSMAFAASKKVTVRAPKVSQGELKRKSDVLIAFHSAVANCDLDGVKGLVESGMDINYSDGGDPPLIDIISTYWQGYGYNTYEKPECMAVFDYFMAQKPDLSVRQPRTHKTAAEVANSSGLFLYLVERGAPFNVRSTLEENALHANFFLSELVKAAQEREPFSARDHSFDRAKYIMENYAVIDQPDADGNTVLMAAAKGGQYYTTWWLLAKGANPNLKNKKGKTAYDMALLTGEGKLITLIKGATQGNLRTWPFPVDPAKKTTKP